jgi:hypothetical protein
MPVTESQEPVQEEEEIIPSKFPSSESVHSYDSSISIKSMTQQELLEEFTVNCLKYPVTMLMKATPKSFKKIPWALISIYAVTELSRTSCLATVCLLRKGLSWLVPAPSANVVGGFQVLECWKQYIRLIDSLPSVLCLLWT